MRDSNEHLARWGQEEVSKTRGNRLCKGAESVNGVDYERDMLAKGRGQEIVAGVGS